MVFFCSKWRINFAENIFNDDNNNLIFKKYLPLQVDSKTIFRIRNKLNWSGAALFPHILFNWKEMQIIQRASPTEREIFILESWSRLRKSEKSREHVNVWKKHQIWAPIPHGNHPCMAPSSMVLYRRARGNAVRSKLTEILIHWKTEHAEKKLGATLTQNYTEMHKICQSRKQWETAFHIMVQETNYEVKWTVWTFVFLCWGLC